MKMNSDRSDTASQGLNDPPDAVAADTSPGAAG